MIRFTLQLVDLPSPLTQQERLRDLWPAFKKVALKAGWVVRGTGPRP